jgi:hypothetical protein
MMIQFTIKKSYLLLRSLQNLRLTCMELNIVFACSSHKLNLFYIGGSNIVHVVKFR